MNKKAQRTKELFEKLNREMPKLARLAVLDAQSYFIKNNERQKEAKTIIQSKI